MTAFKTLNTTVACHQCDSLFPAPNVKENEKALCSCCGSVLFAHKPNSINRSLAISLAGLLLFLPALLLPIVGIGAMGVYNDASLLDCIALMINGKFYIIAFAVFLFTVAIPIVRLIAVFYIAYSIKIHRVKPSMLVFFRSYHILDCWAMTHVFFMGVIVSMYKLMTLADMNVGGGLFSLVCLLICSTLVSTTMDQHLIWESLESSLEPE